MAHEIVFVIHHGAFPADKQDRFAVIQHPHFVGGEKLPTRLLVVDAETAVSSAAVAVGIRVQRLLAHELGNILVGFLFVSAEIEKLVAQADQRFPLLLEQRLDLRHILRDIAAEDVAASHGGKPGQEVVRGQGDVRRFVDEQVNRYRQPAFVFPVGYKIQRLDELPVNHPHKVIEGFIRIRDAAEQGHFFLAHFLQMEVVGVGEPCNLRQVKSRQPDADAD